MLCMTISWICKVPLSMRECLGYLTSDMHWEIFQNFVQTIFAYKFHKIITQIRLPTTECCRPKRHHAPVPSNKLHVDLVGKTPPPPPSNTRVQIYYTWSNTRVQIFVLFTALVWIHQQWHHKVITRASVNYMYSDWRQWQLIEYEPWTWYNKVITRARVDYRYSGRRKWLSIQYEPWTWYNLVITRARVDYKYSGQRKWLSIQYEPWTWYNLVITRARVDYKYSDWRKWQLIEYKPWTWYNLVIVFQQLSATYSYRYVCMLHIYITECVRLRTMFTN